MGNIRAATLQVTPATRAETIERAAAYLPSNYGIVYVNGDPVIVGVDSRGWTLGGYVIPRLASGLMFATEIEGDIVIEPFTRKQYLDDPERGRPSAKHRRYHGQYVNESTIASVVSRIGADRLVASTDPHFNDIPLDEWYRFGGWLPHSGRWKELGDHPSDAGWVCIAKEAARQYVERQSHE